MIKLEKYLLLIGVVGVMCFSCSSDEQAIEEPMAEDKPWMKPVSQKIIDAAKTLKLNADHLRYDIFHYADGTEEVRLYLEEDITIKEEELFRLAEQVKKSNQSGADARQYSTHNLVDQGKTIRVVGRTGWFSGLGGKEQQALRRAVSNYNALNLNLKFELSFGNGNGDIIVYNNFWNFFSVGGQAEFPSNGNPGKNVQIFGTWRISENVTMGILIHEIGHCLGLRHTDWFDRASCGGYTLNEGEAGVGANHIEGTPTEADGNSVMLSCFSGNNFNFSEYDVVALETLYPVEE